PPAPVGATIPLTDSGDSKDGDKDNRTRAESHSDAGRPSPNASAGARRPIPATGERPIAPGSFLEENARALGADRNAPRPPAMGDGDASAKLLASALELRMSSD